MADFLMDHYRRFAYVPESGIAPRHFAVFKEVASWLELAILVRVCNRACVHWIELDYPAKPVQVSQAKTSRETGKVTCAGIVRESQAAEAWRAGFYVLEPDVEGADLRARNPNAAPRQLPARYPPNTPEMSEAGQVVDPECGLALTADYDLLAVIDYSGTRRTDAAAAAAAAGEAADPQRPPAAGTAMTRGPLYERSSPQATRAAHVLNGRLGRRPRIMHGPHDQKYRVDEHNNGGCTAFYPDGSVYFFPTVNDVKEFYDHGLHRRPTDNAAAGARADGQQRPPAATTVAGRA